VTATKTAELVAPKPAPKPTPAVTSTVTQAAPPPVVIVPAAPAPPPQTVYQQPTTVYQQPPVYSSGNSADQQVSVDYPIAEGAVGWWVPQVGSYTDSSSAMAKYNQFESQGWPVFMVRSGDYSSFRYSGYYVILVDNTYASAAEANSWCDAQGLSSDNGFAKRLSHSSGPDGNSVQR
jgi:hypothetical protein